MSQESLECSEERTARIKAEQQRDMLINKLKENLVCKDSLKHQDGNICSVCGTYLDSLEDALGELERKE